MSLPNPAASLPRANLSTKLQTLVSVDPINDDSTSSDDGFGVKKADRKASVPRSSVPTTATSYKVIEEPSRIGRKIRIIVIGAGASALNLAHDVSNSKLDLELVCYEKNPEIGGTWFENKYPGCACDIPSVNYQFSWAPSPNWTS